MTQMLATRPRRRRRRLPVVLALAGTPLLESAGPGPALGLAEPGDVREHWLSGLLSLGLHALLLLAVLLTAVLAPPELIEKVIPVEIFREPAELPGSNVEPAPAGPKAVGLARPSAAAMAVPPLTPEQAAALLEAALQAARWAMAQVAVETEAAPSLPTQIERRDVSAKSLAARAAADVSPVAPSDIAPMRIDPADLAALDLDLDLDFEGPRDIDTSSLTDLSAAETLAALQAYQDHDYTGSVRATTLAPGATLAGGGDGYGLVDTNVSGEYTGRAPGGGGDGTLGAGTGGTGTALGVVRCLESAEVVRYQEMMKQRTDKRWRVPPDVPSDAQVVLRLSLDVAGMARDVEVQSAHSPVLGDSAMQALLSASPFPPMGDANRCLADKRIKMTFTVPQP